MFKRDSERLTICRRRRGRHCRVCVCRVCLSVLVCALVFAFLFTLVLVLGLGVVRVLALLPKFVLVRTLVLVSVLDHGVKALH